MKDNNMMSYEMYEDFKDTMVKTIKTELSAKNNQPTDTDLLQRIEQIVRAEQERHRTIITQLAGRLKASKEAMQKHRTVWITCKQQNISNNNSKN